MMRISVARSTKPQYFNIYRAFTYAQNEALVSREKLVKYSRSYSLFDQGLRHSTMMISLHCCSPCSSSISYARPEILLFG